MIERSKNNAPKRFQEEGKKMRMSATKKNKTERRKSKSLLLVIVCFLVIAVLILHWLLVFLYMPQPPYTTRHSKLIARRIRHKQQQQQQQQQQGKRRYVVYDEPTDRDFATASDASIINPADYGDKERVIRLLQRANVSVPRSVIASLPAWSDVTRLYGEKAVVRGLETCSAFRASVRPSQAYIGPAGLYNTGTNLLAQLLSANCRLPNRTIHGTQIGGMRWQVPWGKHSPPSWRNINEATADRNRGPAIVQEHVLPVVLIKDPYTWMGSMCRHPYEVKWFTEANHCPNLVDTGNDFSNVIDPNTDSVTIFTELVFRGLEESNRDGRGGNAVKTKKTMQHKTRKKKRRRNVQNERKTQRWNNHGKEKTQITRFEAGEEIDEQGQSRDEEGATEKRVNPTDSKTDSKRSFHWSRQGRRDDEPTIRRRLWSVTSLFGFLGGGDDQLQDDNIPPPPPPFRRKQRHYSEPGKKKRYMYTSLVDLWNTWNGDYHDMMNNNNNNSSTLDGGEHTFPRLMVRFEDLLFRPQEVLPSICECAGGRIDSIQILGRSAKEEFHSETSDLLSAIVRYGNETQRSEGMWSSDLEFAEHTLRRDMMEYYGYTSPLFEREKKINGM